MAGISIDTVKEREKLHTRRMPTPSVTDLRDFIDYDFPVRPLGFSRSITPTYAQPRPFGTASGPLHYTGTGLQVLEFELDLLVRGPGEYETHDRFIRYMESALVPDRLVIGTQQQADPTEMLLIWPGTIELVVKLTDFADNPVLFFEDSGLPRRRTLRLQFTEIIDGVLTSTEVRDRGSRRARIFV